MMDKIFLIARPINGISINGNEYLLGADGEPVEFKTKQECIKHCEDVGLIEKGSNDSCYVWEEEVE